MPNRIEISASSMTGLLGAVEASKAAFSQRAGDGTAGQVDSTKEDIYDISRYKTPRNRSGSKTPAAATGLILPNKRIKPTSSPRHPRKTAPKLLKLSPHPPSLQDQLASQALERKAKIYEATMYALSSPALDDTSDTRYVDMH